MIASAPVVGPNTTVGIGRPVGDTEQATPRRVAASMRSVGGRSYRDRRRRARRFRRAVSGQGRGRRDGAGPGHGVARGPRRGRRRRWWCATTVRPTRGWPRPPAGGGRAAARSPVPIEDGRRRRRRRRASLSRCRCRWRRARPTYSTASSPRTASGCGPSGWTAGAIRSRTWRTNVTAKLDAGQSESELSNDLLIGAQLLERAATGVPRQDRATR